MRTYKKKTREIKTRKQNKPQKGGLFIKGDPKNAFDFFIENSKIELFKDTGKNSIMFKATLNENLNSPYVNYTVLEKQREEKISNYQVKTILIKLIALKENNDNNENFWYFHDEPKKITTVKDFEKEVKIQNDIFLNTVEKLQPLCPGIVYHDILTKPDFRTHFKKFIIEMKNVNHIQSWGIIGMEIPEGFKTLYDYYKENFKKIHDKIPSILYHNKYLLYEQIAKIQILKMAIYTGYSHNDFNQNNILVNTKPNSKNNTGKVLLIDFGYATEIDDKTLKTLNDTFVKHDYFQHALNYIYLKFERSDGDKLMEHPTYYGWVYNKFNIYEDYNSFIQFYQEYYENEFQESIKNVKNEKEINDKKNYYEDEYKEFDEWLSKRQQINYSFDKCNTIMKNLIDQEYQENKNKNYNFQNFQFYNFAKKQPKTENPKTENPKPENPKPQKPKTEIPKPKTEPQKPKTENPKTETENPKTENPKPQKPKSPIITENSNYYQILGINQDATPTEIKKKYRNLSLKWHPDKNPNNQAEATSKIQLINKAYEVLKSPSQRNKYNATLKPSSNYRNPFDNDKNHTSSFRGFGGKNKKRKTMKFNSSY
jgi:hypothetical protein